MSLTLYDFMLSGSCYKVRLFLSLLGLEHETELVDYFPGRAHRAPAFLALNPLGQLPVLTDGELCLRDAQAILVYLASRYDDTGSWYPDAPAARGQVAMWLAFAGGELMSASQARLHDVLGQPCDIDRTRARARGALQVLEDHLTDRGFDGHDWLAGDGPTIADIACFPTAALSHDGGIAHDGYPAIQRWLRRVMALPGFITMPGIPTPDA